jgi:hypothetical protein
MLMFGQAFLKKCHPVTWKHFRFVGLVSTVHLLELLGAPFFRGGAKFRRYHVRRMADKVFTSDAMPIIIPLARCCFPNLMASERRGPATVSVKGRS